MPNSTPKTNFNILELLLTRQITNGLGDKIALIDENHEISYNNLIKAVINLPTIAPKIIELPKQSMVACIFDDSIESAVCFLSLIYHGLIPCNLNPLINTNTCDFYLKSISTKLILTETKHYHKFQHYIKNNQIDSSIIESNLIKTLTKNSKKRTFTPHPACDDSPLFCIYTSGTTGYPSAVLHRHKDVKIMNDNYATSILNANPNDRLFTTSRIFFAYGLNNLLIALYHGATAILPPRENNPAIIWQMIQQHKPSIFFSVPTMYKKLISHNDICDMSSTRICVSAGEPLPKEIFTAWKKKLGTGIIDGIGCTEILSTFISNTPPKSTVQGAGKPVRGFQCVIKDRKGNELGANKIGLLWVHGDTYPTNYINNEKASEERFENGWFNTNDLFYKDNKGFFYHQGRLNDLIYKNGTWVFPTRIEERINHHRSIIESAIIGYRSKLTDTIVVAFVTTKSNTKMDSLYSELAQLNEKNSYYQPEEKISIICLINELPKTHTGKIKRHELKNLNIRKIISQRLNNKINTNLVFDIRESIHVYKKVI